MSILVSRRSFFPLRRVSSVVIANASATLSRRDQHLQAVALVEDTARRLHPVGDRRWSDASLLLLRCMEARDLWDMDQERRRRRRLWRKDGHPLAAIHVSASQWQTLHAGGYLKDHQCIPSKLVVVAQLDHLS